MLRIAPHANPKSQGAEDLDLAYEAMVEASSSEALSHFVPQMP